MNIRSLVPRTMGRRAVARPQEDSGLVYFQREINRLFDTFVDDAGFGPWRGETGSSGDGFIPAVNVAETDRELKVVAELPGLDEKDVTVDVDDGAVTIRGERKEECEDREANWYRVERRYGSFQRTIPLPVEVVGDEAKAAFKKGVLTITLPKRPEVERKRKRIDIQAD